MWAGGAALKSRHRRVKKARRGESTDARFQTSAPRGGVLRGKQGRVRGGGGGPDGQRSLNSCAAGAGRFVDVRVLHGEQPQASCR